LFYRLYHLRRSGGFVWVMEVALKVGLPAFFYVFSPEMLRMAYYDVTIRE
jgi:hypothetical protein